MEPELRALLCNAAGVAALVGAGDDARVSWSVRPQWEALPAIVLHKISVAHGRVQRGRERLRSALVQIDCWGRDPKTADDVKEAVIAALDIAPSGSLRALLVEAERAGLDAGAGGQPDYFRTSLDVRVWFSAA